MRSARRIAPVSAVVFAVLATVTAVRAQTPPTFEVVSVKANTSGANQVTVNWQGNVTMINVPLRAIVQYAYGINTPSRLVGYPDWTNVERFDIQATLPQGVSGVPGAPSIFTALPEQLGLKLDAEREVVDVLVIDRIERPSEN